MYCVYLTKKIGYIGWIRTLTWLQWHILLLLFTIKWTIELARIRRLWPPSTQQRTLELTLEAKRAEGVKKTKVWHQAYPLRSKCTRRYRAGSFLRFVQLFCLRLHSPLGPVNYRSSLILRALASSCLPYNVRNETRRLLAVEHLWSIYGAAGAFM